MRNRTGRDIVVIGASAGGLGSLQEIVRALPADLPAAVFVVIHTSPDSPGILPTLLERHSPLPARQAVDHESIQTGQIYVARPDHHLLVKRGYVRVSHGAQENGFRPAVDPLFRTASAAYGPRVIGIVLSGGLDDGTAGIIRIREQGGIGIAQDPEEAVISSMPESVIQFGGADYVLAAADIPGELERLTRETVTESEEDIQRRERNGADAVEATMDIQEQLGGPPSPYTCPACGGSLWELRDGALVRYRCHVGHGYTAEALGAEQFSQLEAAMWSALRALEEHADLRRQMARRAQNSRFPGTARRYQEQAAAAERRADVIRDVLRVKEGARRKVEGMAEVAAESEGPAAGGP